MLFKHMCDIIHLEMINMELRHLQYFLTVANEGSFSQAAKSLYITQPTLSRQIKEMEDEIGKPLFIRGNRHVTLTEEGVFLKVRAEEILSLYNKTTNELTINDFEISGEIYIGAGETSGFSLIAKAIKQVQLKYPNIKFNIYSGDYDDIIERIEKGLIDFGLLISNSQLEKYQQLELPYKDVAGLLIRKDDSMSQKACITRNEIKKLPIFISRQPSSIYMLRDWAKLDINDFNVLGTYNLIYNASILVKEGVGYAFALEHLVDISESSELCFKPFEPQLSAKLVLIWKNISPISKVAQVFLNILKEELTKKDAYEVNP